jgi:DNA-binding NarL/FixJ family response regulator
MPAACPVLSCPSPRLRCLVVEDHLLINDLLVELLAREPGLDVVAGVGTAAEGIAICVQQRPDLLILDIALPDADGLSVARALHVLKPEARVVVLSSFASTVECPRELRDQVVAIIDKTRAAHDLIDAIRPLVPFGVAGSSPRRLDCSSLTPRELEVVELVGQGLTSRAIAAELGISMRTVNTHRSNICGKLRLSGAALIHQATLLQKAANGSPDL